MDSPSRILEILDACASNFNFPMLDNGYVYPSASRMSLYRSAVDWALTVEIFGFMPRAETPDVTVYTFGSKLHARNTPDRYVSAAAYQNYLGNHPHDDARTFWPLGSGFQEPENEEVVDPAVTRLLVRGEEVAMPGRSDYRELGIELAFANEIRVYELCRWLAATRRDAVLATETERRCSIPPGMPRQLTLDEWRHPDLANEQKLGETETFRQLAEVLSTGETDRYRPTLPPNNHWRNWPEGGTL